jgi:hypothetical protein
MGIPYLCKHYCIIYAVVNKERMLALLRLGISSRYVHLCFEAYHRGIVSAARVSEMLLVEEYDVGSIAELFGVRLNDGH